MAILSFFNGFLDILISLERLLDFFPSVRNLTSLKSCFILMFVVIIITFPYFFIYYPAILDVNLSQNEIFRLYFIGQSQFGQSSIGQAVNNVLFFIKDIVAFVIEVVLNIILIVLLRKQMNKKNLMVHSPINTVQPPAVHAESPAEIKFRSNNSKPKTLASKRRNNITVMVVVICLFSGIVHITTIVCTSSFAFAGSSLSQRSCFCFAANFFLSFKSFLNFFIFFFF